MVPIVSFVGKSNSGKTTLLEKVVRELKVKGYRVAVIKHSHHDFDIDIPGKDTWRLAEAGSDIVAISSPRKLAFIEHVDTEASLSRIETVIGSKVDIVLLEGYKNGNAAKILVVGTEHDQEQACHEGEILATVSPHWSELGVPEFHDDDIGNVVDLLIGQLGENSPHKSRDVSTVAAYKAMSDEELFHIEQVLVPIPIEDMPGPPLRRVICAQCGEGFNDYREVTVVGKVLCRACAYGGYYQRYDASAREHAVPRAPSGRDTEKTKLDKRRPRASNTSAVPCRHQ